MNESFKMCQALRQQKKKRPIVYSLRRKSQKFNCHSLSYPPHKNQGDFPFLLFSVSSEDAAGSVIFSPLQGFHCNGSIGLDTGYPMRVVGIIIQLANSEVQKILHYIVFGNEPNFCLDPLSLPLPLPILQFRASAKMFVSLLGSFVFCTSHHLGDHHYPRLHGLFRSG